MDVNKTEETAGTEAEDKTSIEPSPQTETAVDGDCEVPNAEAETKEPAKVLKQETNEDKKTQEGF